MIPRIKNKLADIGMATLAVAAGAAVVYFGDRLLGIKLEYYFGVDTFSPTWALDLFLVPFIAGVVVSLIYGLGGKILAHLSPVLIRGFSFYALSHGLMTPPDGITTLPLSFWLLIAVVSAEFAAIGGVVGETIVKRTYGRTSNKALLHKKHQSKKIIAPQKSSVGGVDQ
jgi:hypothetical protein